MKSLIRWSTTFSIVGGILLGSLLAGGTKVLALTQEQVMERLQTVPVFTITDNQGKPLVVSPAQGEDGPSVAGVFIQRQDAENFLNSLRQNEPEIANTVQVVHVSLAEVYRLALANRDQEDPLRFDLVPAQDQVQSAISLLQESGQTVENYDGVPLFIARSTQDSGGYLTVRQGDREVIPMYFEEDELQGLLGRLREQQPDLANSMTIQVVNLEALIETLQSSENPELTQIYLVPPAESVEFIRSLQPAQGQPNQAQPQQPQSGQ